MLMTFGVSLFFYETGADFNNASSKQTDNLASIEEQLQRPAPPELEGFDNLSKEAEEVDQLLPQTE